LAGVVDLRLRARRLAAGCRSQARWKWSAFDLLPVDSGRRGRIIVQGDVNERADVARMMKGLLRAKPTFVLSDMAANTTEPQADRSPGERYASWKWRQAFAVEPTWRPAGLLFEVFQGGTTKEVPGIAESELHDREAIVQAPSEPPAGSPEIFCGRPKGVSKGGKCP